MLTTCVFHDVILCLTFPLGDGWYIYRRTVLCDYLLRELHRNLAADDAKGAHSGARGWSGPKGGNIQIDMPGQEVIERSAVVLGQGEDGHSWIEARIAVGLPARGRSILGHEAGR
jgi:Predicted ATPase of the ABC class